MIQVLNASLVRLCCSFCCAGLVVMRGFLKLAPTTCLKVESEKPRLHHHVALNPKSLEALLILRNPHVAQSVKSGGGMVTRFRVHALCHSRGLFEGPCYLIGKNLIHDRDNSNGNYGNNTSSKSIIVGIGIAEV